MSRLSERTHKLKCQIPVVYLVMKDKNTPKLAKVMAAVTVAYALSPIDLIPDFIPILGYLDDIILLPLFVTITTKLIPREIWEKNSEKAQHIWENGKPRRWYYAIPIIVIWLSISVLIIRCFI